MRFSYINPALLLFFLPLFLLSSFASQSLSASFALLLITTRNFIQRYDNDIPQS
jgi:hypothetical protein